MTDSLTGDPYHESTKPMMHLQGSVGTAHVQMPMASENVENQRGQNDSEWPGWNTTTIGSGSRGGDTPNAGHDSNGHRTPPAQGPTSA